MARNLATSFLVLSGFVAGAFAADDSRRTYANPVDVDYRYNFEQINEQISYRTGADPVIVRHKDAYYLFMTLADGYWRSTNLLDWSFITPSRWPSASVVAPAAISDGDRLLSDAFHDASRPDPGVARPGTGPARIPDSPPARAAGRRVRRVGERFGPLAFGRRATHTRSARALGSRAVQGRRRPLVPVLGIVQQVSVVRHRARPARSRFAAAHSLRRQAARADPARTRATWLGAVWAGSHGRGPADVHRGRVADQTRWPLLPAIRRARHRVQRLRHRHVRVRQTTRALRIRALQPRGLQTRRFRAWRGPRQHVSRTNTATGGIPVPRGSGTTGPSSGASRCSPPPSATTAR